MTRFRTAGVLIALLLAPLTSSLEAYGRPPPPRAAPRPPPPRPPPRANVNVHVHRGVAVAPVGYYHPVARTVGVAAAATATAIVVGSIVSTLPTSCSAVVVGGLTYHQCGSTWYQPRYSGTTVSYVVVNAPR